MKAIVAAIAILVSATAFAQTEGEKEPIPHSDKKPTVKNWSKVGTIAIAPVQISEVGVGVGLSYEHALDERGILSAYLPTLVTFYPRSIQTVPYNNGTNGSYQRIGRDMLFYAMPGFKFYPTGMGRVKYAVGPSFVAAYGRTSEMYAPMYTPGVYDPVYSSAYGSFSRFLLGAIINNSLNFQVKEHIYAGMEVGFGVTFSEYINGVNYGSGEMLMQGAFKVGYTF